MEKAITMICGNTIFHWNGRKCLHDARCLCIAIPELRDNPGEVITISEQQLDKLLLFARYCPSKAMVIQEIR